MDASKNLSGIRFGRLTVLEFSGKNARLRRIWKCKCDCGKITFPQEYNLVNEHTRSCGCLRDDSRSSAKKTHGMSATVEYFCWVHMKARCYNSKNPKYPQYGGRGITVCKRWLDSFENFFADMGARPVGMDSIDRKDTNGDYTPNNCRWATQSTQQQNRRNSIKVSYQGREITLDDLAVELGIMKHTLYARYTGRSSVPLFEKGSAKKPAKRYLRATQ